VNMKTKLPSHAEWSALDDMKFLRRYELLLKKAPPAALGRLAAYMLDARLRAAGDEEWTKEVETKPSEGPR
jgi:hypothetical protein